jgi:hypothetical protein
MGLVSILADSLAVIGYPTYSQAASFRLVADMFSLYKIAQVLDLA